MLVPKIKIFVDISRSISIHTVYKTGGFYYDVCMCGCAGVCAVCDTVHHDYTVTQTKQFFYSSEQEKILRTMKQLLLHNKFNKKKWQIWRKIPWERAGNQNDRSIATENRIDSQSAGYHSNTFLL
jgi:hypothetical protein